MTPKTFAALATAASLSLVVAIAVHAARAPSTPGSGNVGKLFPNLDTEKVARVAITQGGDTLTFEKSGDRWLTKSQDGYPASGEKIGSLLANLADTRLIEPKTRLATRYSALEVDDPAGKLTNARLFRLEDAGGAVLAEIIAGKSKPASHTGATPESYVRRPSEDQSWLASGEIAGDTKLRSWADQRIFETKTETISTLTVEIPGEAAYVVKRGSDGAHALQDVPTGKKIKYVNMVDNIIEAASFVDFEKVRKATGATGGDAGKVSFETDAGLKVTLNIRREKDATWATIATTGEGDAKATAAEIAARADGWEFSIQPSKADTMLKKRDDLLEDAAS